MDYLERLQASFYDELEKIAAKKPPKETRKGWGVSTTRKKSRPMRVATLLRKEKEGTLGGYKLAQFYGPILPFTETSDRGAAKHPDSKKPGRIPSRDDMDTNSPKREDGRDFTSTIQGPGAVMTDIGATSSGNDK